MNLNNYDFGEFTIQDPIHGSITFGIIERAVIDHRFFQRLHGLRQNSLLYLSFPSANHTRFDHSVGVMWLSDKFFKSIISNQKRIIKKGKGRKSFQKLYRVDDKAIIKTIDGISSDKYYLLLIRVAGLFHDIGHGPFSHLFDKFFPDGKNFKDLLGSDKEFKHIKDYLNTKNDIELKKPIKHELLSCVIATRVLLDCKNILKNYNIKPYEMIKDVCSIIKNEIKPSSNLSKFSYNTQFLFSEIISSDIDVDRMDYLLRDSHMSGVNYGLYEPNRILKSMCAYGLVQSKQLRVGIRYSSLGALEDFLHSRYQMHKQIYGHKTNRACNTMLDQIRDRLSLDKWTWYSGFNNVNEFLDKFKDFDDSSFVQYLLSKHKKKKNKINLEIKEIAEKLFLERRLTKKVYEEIIDSREKSRLKKVKMRLKKFEKKFAENGIRFKVDEFENKGPKLKGSEGSLRVLKKGKEGFYLVKTVFECSSFIKGLPEKEYIFRAFCRNSKRDYVKKMLTI